MLSATRILVAVVLILSTILAGKLSGMFGSTRLSTSTASLLSLTDTSAPVPSLTPSQTVSKIVFVSGRDGNKEIFVMNADGTAQTRLTNNPAFDGRPSWSPDGRRIAFVSDRDGNLEIYVISARGSNEGRLTENTATHWGPVWSPR